MRLKGIIFTLAAICVGCTAGRSTGLPLYGYGESGIIRMFLDAHNPDQPAMYSHPEIKRTIHDAKTPEDFKQLVDYFDLSIY